MDFHKYRGVPLITFNMMFAWSIYTQPSEELWDVLILKHLHSSKELLRSSYNGCSVSGIDIRKVVKPNDSRGPCGYVCSGTELEIIKLTTTAWRSRIWSPWALASYGPLFFVISTSPAVIQLPKNPVPPVETASEPSRHGFGPPHLTNTDSTVFSEH